jgi:hypothetical protein
MRLLGIFTFFLAAAWMARADESSRTPTHPGAIDRRPFLCDSADPWLCWHLYMRYRDSRTEEAIEPRPGTPTDDGDELKKPFETLHRRVRPLDSPPP